MKRKGNMHIKLNRNNLVLGTIIVVLLLVTGILPAMLELVFGLLFGIIGLVVGLVAGAIGLVIGIASGIAGLIFGLLPILIPVAIVYFAVKMINRSDETPKRKREIEIY